MYALWEESHVNVQIMIYMENYVLLIKEKLYYKWFLEKNESGNIFKLKYKLESII